jgi:pyrimidine-specific ribonucleoside hydrolase
MIDVIYDMETSDPDDAFTLCLLACHSQVNLRAVTVTPGSDAQVAVVSELLRLCKADNSILIGVRSPKYPKTCVSEFHYKWLGPPEKFHSVDRTVGPGFEILHQTLQQYPECVLLTGASLGNPRMLFEHYPSTQIKRWVGQGGFAGDSVVPPEYRLEKFAGRETCPTFNFNGDVPGAKLLLSSPNIELKQLVSKNVCHGLAYDQPMHQEVAKFLTHSPGTMMIYSGMFVYLKDHPSGKKFHDPLAACTLIDPSICEFKEVEVYREKGEWGSRLKEGTNTLISIHADTEKFFRVLVDLPS